jgi:hypothetical protein
MLAGYPVWSSIRGFVMRSLDVGRVTDRDILNILAYNSQYSGVLGYFKLLLSVVFFEYEADFSRGKSVIDSISERNYYASQLYLFFDGNLNKFVKTRRVRVSFILSLGRMSLLRRLLSRIVVSNLKSDEIIVFNQYGIYEYVVARLFPGKVSFAIHSYVDGGASRWCSEDVLNYELSGEYMNIYVPLDFKDSDFINAFSMRNGVDPESVIFFSSDPIIYHDEFLSYPLKYLSRREVVGSSWRLIVLAVFRRVVVFPHPKNKYFCRIFAIISMGRWKRGLSSKIIVDEMTSPSVARRVEKLNGRPNDEK